MKQTEKQPFNRQDENKSIQPTATFLGNIQRNRIYGVLLVTGNRSILDPVNIHVFNHVRLFDNTNNGRDLCFRRVLTGITSP